MGRTHRLGRLALGLALLAGGCAPRGEHRPLTAAAPPAHAGPCLANLPTPLPAPSTAGMVFVNGGAFPMGAGPLRREEGPPRATRVSGFWVDRTDVTNAEFARFIAATGYVTLAERPLDPKAYPQLHGDQLKPSAIVFVGSDRPPGSDPSQWWRVVPGANWRHPEGPGSDLAGKETLPVVQVAFADALAYARWLGRDLPTEAEWEYAARGGRPPARYVWGEAPFDDKHPQANVWQGVFPALDTGADGYKAQASPVGCFPANGFGLYDMAGDVWQWTRDVYLSNLAADDKADPRGPGPTPVPGDVAHNHVIKGGSFLCSPDYCFRYRPAAREAGPTDTGENHIGFRTVLRVAGPPPATHMSVLF